MEKLANGKFGKKVIGEDWAVIRPNRVFRVFFIRQMLNLTEPVKYLKETIEKCDEFEQDEYLITILCNDDNQQIQVLEIPLSILCLNKHQQEELVLHGLVSENYFNKQVECENGYYLYPDDPYLLHKP